jgi:hypothetical protein
MNEENSMESHNSFDDKNVRSRTRLGKEEGMLTQQHFRKQDKTLYGYIRTT